MKLNRKGQTLVEYVLIISLITVVAIGLEDIYKMLLLRWDVIFLVRNMLKEKK